MKWAAYIFLFIISCTFIGGCSETRMDDTDNIKEEVKIAVVLSDKKMERWERIMDLARKNISSATGLVPVFEFYEENSHDMMILAHDLAHDDSIISVIGCEDEDNTDILAYQMSRLKKQKPMFTFNTSQQVIRKYSTQGFMWGLSESDITQSEVLLASIAARFGNSDIALIANNGSYGQTFIDWFAFHASELGLNPKKIYTYEDISQIRPYMEEISRTKCLLLCVPDSHEEAVEMVRYSPVAFTYYSHKAFNREVLESIEKIPDIEYPYMHGVALVPDPASGFHNIYETRYGQAPAFGEAQLYDSIMITCLAYAMSKEKEISVNSAVAALLGENSNGHGGWTKEGIEDAYRTIVNRQEIPDINGATGRLAFYPDKHTIIQYSTYALQFTADNEFHCYDYISRNDGRNTSSIVGAWEWDKIFSQDIDIYQEEIIDSHVTGINPVIIASSRGWNNYRHQADALAIYQLLKSRGFSDDDIILILADDIAYNENNPYPGKVFRMPTEEDSYKGAVIDYKLEDLSARDLKDILLGNKSERLPVVVKGSPTENILLFWSGHGRPGSLIWDTDENSITGKFLNETLREMSEQGNFRKLFAVIEACYAGSIAKECVGIPGVLFMTAANDMETSKAELYDPTWKTYMTNSFTSSIINSLNSDEPRLSELYQDAFKMTMGSHVTLYNTENYGNIYINYADEFFWNYY